MRTSVARKPANAQKSAKRCAGGFNPAGDCRADRACYCPGIVCTFGSGKDFVILDYDLRKLKLLLFSYFLFLSLIFKNARNSNNTDDGSGLIQPQQLIGVGNAGVFMSASLILLFPVILLGIVGMLCFVGCGLPVEGLPNEPFTEYTGKTVLLEKIMAYWPLNDVLTDKDNPAPALERVSKIPSSYIDPVTAPLLYKWLDIPVSLAPDVLSAAAPGTIKFNQPGIVPGDAVVAGIPSIIQSCVVVNGCYVEAPFNAKFVPPSSFTAEAWVRVDWSSGDPNAFRFVLDMRDFSPVTAGFGICAKTIDGQPGAYQWRGIIGDGSAAFTFADTSELTVALTDSPGSPTTIAHLALTYDAGTKTLTLFVNADKQAEVTNVGYAANTVQPLWIGAGAPYVPRRPSDVAVTSPLFPFVGAIQDVAIYSVALDPTDIRRHFNNGNGTNPP
jgi:hypothetical protein